MLYEHLVSKFWSTFSLTACDSVVNSEPLERMLLRLDGFYIMLCVEYTSDFPKNPWWHSLVYIYIYIYIYIYKIGRLVGSKVIDN